MLALATALPGGSAVAQEVGKMEWFGSVYAKFLDGNRKQQNGLYGNSEFGNGDLGQGIEFELLFRNQVSRQVEVGGRLQGRFNQNYWSNFGGFSDDEKDPLRAQYIKLRGVYARLTPGYDWVDSVLIGNSDFGLWDPLTLGKFRYIDRDNAAGIIAQGTAGGGAVKWDVARLSLPKLWAGPGFNTGALHAQDAAYIGQVKVAASPVFNTTAILMGINDDEVDATDNDIRDGVETTNRYSNYVAGLKGQFTGVEGLDISFAGYYSEFNIANNLCGPGAYNGGCRFSPTLAGDADDVAGFLNLEVGELLPNLTFSAQAFHIGAEYLSVLAARREADVLLTEGSEGSWAWSRPDYNFGNPANNNARAQIGYGGWNGHMDQVVALAADNDFTDFDERAAQSVIGWEGLTIVPRYSAGDLELQGEVSYITFDTNWQACGKGDKDLCIFPRQEGTHSWGLGGDWRSPYAPYQDRDLWIVALNGNYTVDVGSGLQLGGRLKYQRDADNRVTNASLLGDAYDYATTARSCCGNAAWEALPDAERVVSGVGDDDRKADYWTLGASAGYQVFQDLFARLVYEYQYVDLFDGTTNVAPVGLGFEASNEFGWAEYLTGEHTKNKVALQTSYFLSGIEIGADVQYLWGEFSPEFYAGSGQTIQRATNGAVITPMGNISPDEVELDAYRMKAFLKVQF